MEGDEIYSEGEVELRKQIGRTGLRGEWIQDDLEGILIFKTEYEMPLRKETNAPRDLKSASLRFHLQTRRLQFQGDSILQEKFKRASASYDDPLANLDRIELPDRIIENLYLGGQYASLNRNGLKEKKCFAYSLFSKGFEACLS